MRIKSIFMAIAIIIISFSSLFSQEPGKYGFVEIGRTKVSLTIADVKDPQNKVFDDKTVQFFQFNADVSASLSKTPAELTEDDITNIAEALSNVKGTCAKTGVKKIFTFLSSSYADIEKGKRQQYLSDIKIESGFDALYYNTKKEALAVAGTALISYADQGLAILIGSSTTRGGLLIPDGKGGYFIETLVVMEGITKLKDEMIDANPLDDETYLTGRHVSIINNFEKIVTTNPNFKTRKVLVLCGDAPSILAKVLGKTEITLSDLNSLRKRIKNPEFQATLTANAIDAKTLLVSIHFIEAIMEEFPLSKTIIDPNERSFAFGAGLDLLASGGL